MFLGTILSGFFFLLPVLVTSGIYVGLNYQQVINVIQGKVPPPGTLNPDGSPKTITTTRYCDKFNAIIPFPSRYLLNPNVWGDPDNTGYVCMNVTTNPFLKKNEPYAANWTATWNFPQATGSQPVHAYPNAMLNSTLLPIEVSNLKDLVLDVQWSYAVGNEVAASNDEAAVTASGMNANVALDMFLSNDKTKAGNASLASFEVMVWLGTYGASTKPIGYTADKPFATQTINGTVFNLYYGANGLNQQVFTWMTPTAATEFAGDIAPLITSLATIGAAPQAEAYLGYMAFGTEAFYSTSNMTLSVQRLKFDVNKKT